VINYQEVNYANLVNIQKTLKMISHHENHIPRASNKLWRMVKVIDCLDLGVKI